jgi:hypothetical protein
VNMADAPSTQNQLLYRDPAVLLPPIQDRPGMMPSTYDSRSICPKLGATGYHGGGVQKGCSGRTVRERVEKCGG